MKYEFKSLHFWLPTIFFFLVTISGCSINNQASQIQALEKCDYEIVSADSIYIAGKDISSVIKNRNFDLNSMPNIAMAYLNQNIPFNAVINLEIKNPTTNLAGINQFEYKILMKGVQLANGFVNKKVSIEPGAKTTIPVKVNANIYPFISNGKTLKEIMDFVQGGSTSGTEKKGIVTLMIKPTIALGNKLLNYPGYITIDKEVSSKILF